MEARCPMCNARQFDVERGIFLVVPSSDWDGHGEVVIERKCKCGVFLIMTFASS